MDNLCAVIRWLVLLLAGFSTVAGAAGSFPASTGTTYSYTAATSFGVVGGGFGQNFATAEAACASYVGHSNIYIAFNNQTSAQCLSGSNVVAYVAGSCPDSSWESEYTSASPWMRCRKVASSSAAICPANSTLSGSTCTCDSGYNASGTTAGSTCVRVCPAAGTAALGTPTPGGNRFLSWRNPAYNASTGTRKWQGVTQTACENGCRVSSTFALCVPVAPAGDPEANYNNCGMSNPIYSGTNCTGTETAGAAAALPSSSPTVAEQKIATKQGCIASSGGYAVVNGVVTCVGGGTTENPVTTWSETSKTGADGTVTKTTQLVKDDGQTVTTTGNTAVTAPGGATTTTVAPSETKAKADFCETRPDSPICKGSSVTGGTDCDSSPVCTGDAATCAIVYQAHETRCQAKKVADSVQVDASYVASAEAAYGYTSEATDKAKAGLDGSKDFDFLAVWNQKKQAYLTMTSTCPQIDDVQILGGTVAMSKYGIFACKLADIFRVLFHLLAYVFVLRLFLNKV